MCKRNSFENIEVVLEGFHCMQGGSDHLKIVGSGRKGVKKCGKINPSDMCELKIPHVGGGKRV